MSRKKKRFSDDSRKDYWTRYDWDSLMRNSRSPSYVYEPSWDDFDFNDHHDFFDNYDIRPRWIKDRHRMTRIATPWLVTMSLLGVHHMVNSANPTHISQELEAPFLSNMETSTPRFDTDVQNHRINDFSSFDTTQGTTFKDDTSTMSNHRYPDTYPMLKKSERNIDNDLEKVQQNLGQDTESEKIYNPNHTYKPPLDVNVEDEYVGHAMELVYYWNIVDFEFPDIQARKKAIVNGDYIPENNLPLGLEVWQDKVFVSLPRWKKGVPATLATIPRNSTEKSPKLTPYPSWEWHQPGNCKTLTSVFRMQIDDCDRLWVMDSGRVDVGTEKSYQQCPPAIFIFDLKTDTLVRHYVLKKDEIKDDSLFSNIVVDVRYNECLSAVAYMVDVWRFGLVVYDFFRDESFRLQHHLFFPDPLASKYELHGLTFHWTDGIFGIALSPIDVNDDRTLFFHPMSSFREFAVPTSTLRNKRTADENVDKFIPIGKPRAKDYGHSSGSAIDKNGIMFFNMVTRDSVWCWDTRKEYIPRNLGVIAANNVSMVFPNDIRVDHEIDPNVWVLSNRLPMYLYGYWNSADINFRIYKANVMKAVQNTICDPTYVIPEQEIGKGYDETC